MARQLAFATALATVLFVTLLALLGGIATPGYSHVSQFISELGATQAPYEYASRFIGFLPAGIALLAFAWLAHGALPKSRLTTLAFLALAIYALGYIAAAFFPCDPGCQVNPARSNAIGVAYTGPNPMRSGSKPANA